MQDTPPLPSDVSAPAPQTAAQVQAQVQAQATSHQKPQVTIAYCTGCNWLLRAGWMAQELLSTFSVQLGGVTLIPDDMGGTFEIAVDGAVIWERKRDGGFPDVKTLKSRLRDQIAPEQDLGHIDRSQETVTEDGSET